MKLTENYGLKKPDPTDIVNVYDFNYNADIIDSKLKEAEESLSGLELVASNVKMNDGASVEDTITDVKDNKGDKLELEGALLHLKSGEKILSTTNLKELGLSKGVSYLATGHLTAKSDWEFSDKHGMHYVEINHELNTNSPIVSYYDIETKMSMFDIYEVIDSNNIRVYSDVAIDTYIAVIDGTGDITVVEALIDDNRVADIRTWSSEKINAELSGVKNDISNINNELSKTENTKYSTENGVKEFSCKDGYVDNIVIEGETLVNIGKTITKNVGNDAIRTRFEGNGDDYRRRYSGNTFTLINYTDKIISFPTMKNTNNQWSNQYDVQPNSRIAVQIPNDTSLVGVDYWNINGWTVSNDTVINDSFFAVLEGDHTDKPISYFEGLKSVGQGDKIEVLTINGSKYDLSGATYATGFFNSAGELDIHDKHKVIEQYLEVEEGKTYVLENIAQATCYYDVNKNLVHYNIDTLICNSLYPHYIQDIHHVFYSVVKIPKGVKYIRVSTGINSVGKINIYKDGKCDHKQISTTLRSLPNGVKDTIEKRGNKYVKVQRCGEYVVNSSIGYSVGTAKTNTIDHCIAIPNIKSIGTLVNNPQDETRNIYCDALKEVSFKYISDKGGWDYIDEEFITHEGNYVVMSLSKAKVNSQDADAFYSWIKDNPITVVYELATPKIIELPNFNPQTYSDTTTLLLNSGVVQANAEFEVTNSKGSEIEVLKDKVSSLDNYESGYEYSNEIIYLNGTHKPSWAEDPYIVKIGKICILHCILGNNATTYGLPLIKLPSFAQPKQHHRYFGRGKGNDSSTLMIMDFDISTSGVLCFYMSDIEVTKLNQLYVHAVWEVE